MVSNDLGGLCSLEDGGLKMDWPEKFLAPTEFIKTGMVETLIGVEPLDNSSSLKDMIWTIKCSSPNLIEAVLFFQLARQTCPAGIHHLNLQYVRASRSACCSSQNRFGHTSSNKDCRNPRQNFGQFFFLIGISSLTLIGISTRTSTVLYVYKRKANCIIEILYTNEGDRFDN